MCTYTQSSEDRSHYSPQSIAELALLLARRADVYPGVVLVSRNNDERAVAYAIRDNQFDPSVEQIIGVSAWGPFAEHRPGMWRLGDSPTAQYVLPLSGNGDRPRIGISAIDCWTYRSDVIRHILQSKRYMSYVEIAPETMSRAMLEAAFGAIVRIHRKTASDLLTSAPDSLGGKLCALSTVADQPTMTPDMLSSANQELLSLSQKWNEQRVVDRKPINLLGPTLQDLIEAAECSCDTVSRVRSRAEIKPRDRGSRYTLAELDALIKAADEYTTSTRRQDMVEGWTRLRQQIGRK